MEYIKENPGSIDALIENVSTKNRENAVACAMMVEELSGNAIHTAAFMKQPADLLRYAAFKSLSKDALPVTLMKQSLCVMTRRQCHHLNLAEKTVLL